MVCIFYTTNAVVFSIAVPAMKAVRSMVTAVDFDKRMLLLATKLANESDMKELLLLVLEELLNHMQLRQDSETRTELIGLIRCVIRLDLKMMTDQAGIDLFVHRDLSGTNSFTIQSFIGRQYFSL